MTKVGRNDPCPCDSGKKAKKCHERAVGSSVAPFRWYLDTLAFIESCDGYEAPVAQGERKMWEETGCPFGTCCHDLDKSGCAAPNCGV